MIGRLWMRIGEGDDAYGMPDPDGLRDAYDRVYAAVHPHLGPAPAEATIDRGDLARLLTLAHGYLVLTTDGGQEQMVGKLRDVRRARREAGR